MSVLIKGMDMPKEPWDCPCHDGETGQCKVINIGCYDCVPKCCPLVEVPTPHGRLVDADEITKDMNTFQDSFVINVSDGRFGEISCTAKTVVESEVE